MMLSFKNQEYEHLEALNYYKSLMKEVFEYHEQEKSNIIKDCEDKLKS